MKYTKVVELKETGWSEWIIPKPDYKMACCDCGLIHDIEFRVVKQGRSKRNGTFSVTPVPSEAKQGHFRVYFRARRNTRATAAMRRERKKKENK